MNGQESSAPSRTLMVFGFAAIYLVWGSTYLAIRVVVETLPPFASAGVRFLVAGGVLIWFLARKGIALPTPGQWRHAAVSGGLLLVGGNGLVMWAEQTIPSGLTALLIALAPVWFALLDWLRPDGVRPTLKTVLGIVIGFAGVAMLVQGRSAGTEGSVFWGGALALIVAGLCWAGGSLYVKHNPTSGSSWMNAAAQMLCGGAGLLLVGILFGEPFRTEWWRISTRSLVALGYLIVFGSWIGFSAYVWLLKVSTPTRVSTYAYVNPVIAVLLGWALLGESITVSMLKGALLILAGVVIITVPRASMVQGWERITRLLTRSTAP